MRNLLLYDGTVRCASDMDASSYDCLTDDPCLYCGETSGTMPVEVAEQDPEQPIGAQGKPIYIAEELRRQGFLTDLEFEIRVADLGDHCVGIGAITLDKLTDRMHHLSVVASLH